MKRRQLVHGMFGAGALAALSGCASLRGTPSAGKVVIVGGGYGGATAAKYVRALSDHSIDVVLIEPNKTFVSCPISNLVVGGVHPISHVTMGYEALRDKHGVSIVHDTVTSINVEKKVVHLASSTTISYEKLILSPGVELMYDTIEGLRQALSTGHVLQAWKAGPETTALFKQVQAMPDGGVFAIAIPEAPYRCPPGPYERASLVADYLKKHKPRSKVLILDANQDVTSKGPLFKKAWKDLYGGMVEYRPQHKAVAVDAKAHTLKFDVQEDVKADVLNVLPLMRAGSIAVKTGLANSNDRWCSVSYQTFESTAAEDVHVIGDAIQTAPLMPKSAHMANNHAKVVAAAVVAQLKGLEINPDPVLTNTCYSFVSQNEVIHVASVHEYVAADKTFKPVQGSGGVSSARSEIEARYAMGWARNIWADTLAV